MSDTALFGKAAACLGSVQQGCQVLILSEDFTAYTRASQVCRRVMDQMGQRTDSEFRCWNFSELTDPACAQSATRCAAAADMLVISTQNAVLPTTLNDWIDSLRLARFRPVGVLALILNKPARQADIDRLLRRMEAVATYLVMDFMPLLPPANEETGWQPQSPENWEMQLGRPDLENQRDVDRWSAND